MTIEKKLSMESSSRLEKLEHAEDLVIELLECAASAIKELKEIQADSSEKEAAFLENCGQYYNKLAEIRNIIFEELDGLDSSSSPPARRPGVDQLTIATWEAKVIADNVHELLE